MTRTLRWATTLLAGAILGTVALAAPAQAATISQPLRTMVANLTVATEVRTGYNRSLFPHWIDADGDGCDTRREVLIAEAVIAPSIGLECRLTGGSWVSAYDGLTLTDLGSIDIDHVVALAEAWDSGAAGWTDDRRRDFANDLGVDWALIAVSSGSNRSKSDHDPAEWLPVEADRCAFITAWIEVKVRWSLAIDARERGSLVEFVAACPAVSIGPVPVP